MYFPARKDVLYYLLIWGTVASIILYSFFQWGESGPELTGLHLAPLSVLVRGFLISFILWFWFGTGYAIREQHLEIKHGPFRKTIPINEIISVHRSKSVTVEPALSISRLQLTYGRAFGVISISPRDEDTFIRLLLQENPDIKVDV